MKKGVWAFSLALMVICLVGPLHADTIIVGNANWYEFIFSAVGVNSPGGGGVPSSGGNSEYAPNTPWTFTSAVPVFLTVTDAFLEGDCFTITDVGSFLGATPLVANTGMDSGTSDPAVALGIPQLSHAVFTLAAGYHSLEIAPSQIVSPGAAFFRMDPIPLPGSVFLFGSGLLGLIGLKRKFHS